MKTIRLHTCDNCGKESQWGDGWMRWDSMLTQEFGHAVITCSDECRNEIGDPAEFFKKKYGRSAGSNFYTRLG